MHQPYFKPVLLSCKNFAESAMDGATLEKIAASYLI